MRPPAIDFEAIPSPIMLRGNAEQAYRDPCGHYHDGVFRVWHSNIRGPADSSWCAATAVTESRDLITWSEPRDVTERDRTLNYSSPGNVIRHRDRWLMCLQTYPSADGRPGDHTARVFTMHSNDLEQWSQPELLRVKGPAVPRTEMGRMIDPYLIEDQAEPGTWWCFYKQNGASRSWSRDLQHWTYAGRVAAGENVCLLAAAGEYTMFHSPANGIGIKRSPDLERWTDHGLLTLGQREWPWAQGRITAGQVLDLRAAPGVGRYVMFFHGSSPAGSALQEVHGHASLGIAWSTDLVHWQWPGGGSDD
jgi:hypothetical protein